MKVLWDDTHGMIGKRGSTVPIFESYNTSHIISNNVNKKEEMHPVQTFI